jgi:hypothetical protein
MDTGDLPFFLFLFTCLSQESRQFSQKKAVYATMKRGSDMQPYEMNGFL